MDQSHLGACDQHTRLESNRLAAEKVGFHLAFVMGTQAEDLEIAKQETTFAAVGSVASSRVATDVPSASALTAFHLQKTYSKRRVVDDVSLHVGRGEVVVGFLLGDDGQGADVEREHFRDAAGGSQPSRVFTERAVVPIEQFRSGP